MNFVANGDLAVLSPAPSYKRVNQSASRSQGTYKPTGDDFVASFYAVLRRWESETAFSSNPMEICDHTSFAALVQNAGICLDLISDELARGCYKLAWVLEDHFDKQPYEPEDFGNLERMAGRWISFLEARDQ